MLLAFAETSVSLEPSDLGRRNTQTAFCYVARTTTLEKTFGTLRKKLCMLHVLHVLVIPIQLRPTISGLSKLVHAQTGALGPPQDWLFWKYSPNWKI